MTTKLKEDARSAAKAQGISFSRLVRESLERNIDELAKSPAQPSVPNGTVK
jgi:predicted HicB family RNase H-like nuclease